MQQFIGERVLMRVHLGEADEHDGVLVYRKLVELIRASGAAGCTVFRGAMSFGSGSVVHSDNIEVMALDLPIVVECVESEEKIAELLPKLDHFVKGGLITLERAEVILYRPHDEATA